MKKALLLLLILCMFTFTSCNLREFFQANTEPSTVSAPHAGMPMATPTVYQNKAPSDDLETVGYSAGNPGENNTASMIDPQTNTTESGTDSNNGSGAAGSAQTAGSKTSDQTQGPGTTNNESDKVNSTVPGSSDNIPKQPQQTDNEKNPAVPPAVESEYSGSLAGEPDTDL